MKPITTVEHLYTQSHQEEVETPILCHVATHLRVHPGHNGKSLAKALNVKRHELSAAIKLLTGKTLDAMLNQWHMMKALELLRSTDLDFQSIASQCGYRKSKYLADAMKRQMKMTPFEYRNGYRRGVERPHRSWE